MPTQNTDVRQRFLIILAAVIQAVGLVLKLYLNPLYWKQDYHTSALSGWAWTQELIEGHPDRIYCELGMRLHVFMALVMELRLLGVDDSKGLPLEERVAIFLYTCVTGIAIDHVAERFQHSKSTISMYFHIYICTSY